MLTKLRSLRWSVNKDAPQSGRRLTHRSLAVRGLSLLMALALGAGSLPSVMPRAEAAALAFPGAVGYGAGTPGGRGGRVIYVTNLNDSGPGSLRDALEASGPRIVIVKVAGTIVLSGGSITVGSPYLSLYGNKAPGQGIQLRKGGILIKTHDVIIRYVKVRSGDESGGQSLSTRDPIATGCGSGKPYNIILDHVSSMWGVDGGSLDIGCGATNVTVQKSILAEGIEDGGHPDGPHSKGPSVLYPDATIGGSDKVTLWHNVMASSKARMPMIKATGRIDLINNVIYNWGQSAGEGVSRSLNVINNTWKKGPASSANCAWKNNLGGGQPSSDNGPAYFAGNDLSGGMSLFCNGQPTTNSRYAPSISDGAILSAGDAYNLLIAGRDVGANQPGGMDSEDTRILNNVQNGTGSIPNGPGGPNGWPDLGGGTPYADSDGDGMPDDWERANGFNPGNGGDGNGDADGDGYTNVEEFLNSSDAGSGGGGGTLPTSTPVPTQAVSPTPTQGVSPTPAPIGSTLEIAVGDDAFTNKNNAGANYGNNSELNTDSSPAKVTWLRFAVAGATAPITRAYVRMYVTDPSNAGGDLYRVTSNSWSENRITWSNQPAIDGPKVASVGAVRASTWYEWDVTAAVTGDGTYTFALKSGSADGADYKSGETGRPPKLVLVFGTSGSGTSMTPSVDPVDDSGSTPAQPAPTPEPTAVPAPQTLALNPTDDSYTNKNQEGDNYGGAGDVQVDGDPKKISWLKFHVSGVSGTVTRARLRLYAVNGSADGGTVYRVGDSAWSQGSITWANQPSVGDASLGSLGAVVEGTWYEVDVTSAVTGNGTYTFAIRTDRANGAWYAANESGSNRPELIIDYTP